MRWLVVTIHRSASGVFRSSWAKSRYYATMSKISDFHEKHQLDPWPKNKEPTPQQIFGLTNHEFALSQLEFSKLLKTKYNKYLKIYHPDILGGIDVYNEKSALMTPEMKRSRFDMVQKAYEVLKDPKRRLAYGRSVTTDWSQYSANSSSFDAYRMANAHRKRYDFKNNEEFWRAGTWEDYYRMKHNRAPPTREELEKNKYKILVGVIAIMAITTTIQLILAFENSNSAQYQIHLQNLRLLKESEKLSHDEYANRFSTIRQFLLSRRANVNDINKLREMELQDAKVLTDYARKKVGELE
ncbi:hypothetical protein CANTEDRAFT_133891 [Yamadazyma tenuis ATCC 10573]|uniref:J domain-containing protein n=1 Tax=Candida tenuis (strain ATCC 10573 / BCRC 21748 / CBS 615 / JCM 9827 / NBRC 10315 / NRRL Y-1498 / VKM Y-70) TaxID=590646 RepID=G3B216_CANTC|nr:uncharacterized protein CANTEDRAFT_133891 [Yamadazyma tenuis ATCC 10573]EGV64581.1 hypothetical protein CANTEDRAFT_133891 [Yamadazyma tenuis ATCC 10573]